LAAAQPGFVVLYVYGPGGVGKTALLQRFADAAAQAGVAHIRVDGHGTESPHIAARVLRRTLVPATER